MLVFALFHNRMFPYLRFRIVVLIERNFLCMFLLVVELLRLVLVVFIDEFFASFSILAQVALAVLGDLSSNLFPSVKFIVFTVGFGLNFNVLNFLNFHWGNICFVTVSLTLIVYCISA